MRKMTGLAVMIGAALAAGCKSDNDTVATKPATQPTNVIFFLGDGMGLNTLTAARIYGVGEEGDLTIDTPPYQRRPSSRPCPTMPRSLTRPPPWRPT